MHEDQIPYLKFAKRQNLHKSIKTISGIFRGISLDKKLTDGEVKFLQDWLVKNNHATLKHPYNEITKTIRDALADGVITTDEQENILWLCEKFNADHGFYNNITRSIQHLHGITPGPTGNKASQQKWRQSLISTTKE